MRHPTYWLRQAELSVRVSRNHQLPVVVYRELRPAAWVFVFPRLLPMRPVACKLEPGAAHKVYVLWLEAV